MRSPHRIAALATFTCAFISPGSAARAQRTSSAIGELEHVAWTIRDGAPTSVQALAQSADGMLWIGTTTGLYQFDGVKFEPLEASGVALPSLIVSALLALPDGKLWIGYTWGGASVLQRGRLVSYAVRDGVPAGGVNGFAVDSAGQIWVATTTGLGRFRDGRWEQVGSESGYPGGMTSDLLVDRRGTLWAAASSGVFVLPRGATRFTAGAPSLDPAGSGGGMPREAPDGSVWGASTTLGLTRLTDSVGNPTPSRPEVAHFSRARGLLVDRHANAWLLMGEAAGFFRVPLGVRSEGGQDVTRQPLRVTRVPMASGRAVGALLEDREGNVWVGTSDGLDRFRETKLTPVIFPAPISYPALVAGEAGSVWVGSYSEFVLFPIRDSVAVHRVGPTDISCAYRDLSGGVWLGGRAGMWHAPPTVLSPATRFTRITLPAEAAAGEVQAIAQSLDGDLWVSMFSKLARGVLRRRGGVWSRFPAPQGAANPLALTIVTDSVGRTWLGYNPNRLVLASRDSTRVYTEVDGLQLGAVTAMLVRGSRLWIGGESGVMVLEGERFRAIDATVRLRGITGIVQTVAGDLWLNGADGVTHIESGEVLRALQHPGYRARAERLDYHDGLNGDAPAVRPLPTAIEGTDGRLWFATTSGVAWLHPTSIKRNTLPPPVQIRAVSAGGRRYNPAGPIALPPGTSDVQIAYTAGSLAVPDRVRFRYRLVGIDTAWQEPGGRRDVYYTNLKPGSYRFQVMAANEDGVWNKSGATLDLTIPPTFVQSRWFVAVWVLALSAVVWIAYRVRMRQVAAGLRARYAAALSERTRIAQELHDTLLQGFTGITIQLRAIQRVLTRRPEEGVAALEVALTAADTTLRDARNTIWDMRTVELEGRELPEALEGAMRSLLTGAPVMLHFTVRGDRRPLTPHLETTALRIGREAVVNALKHANARRVEVNLEYDAKLLRLQIRDDGRGMHNGVAEAAAADGHLGIAGMRARAQSAAGTMEIASEPGRGTTVRVSLPIAS